MAFASPSIPRFHPVLYYALSPKMQWSLPKLVLVSPFVRLSGGTQQARGADRHSGFREALFNGLKSRNLPPGSFPSFSWGERETEASGNSLLVSRAPFDSDNEGEIERNWGAAANQLNVLLLIL